MSDNPQALKKLAQQKMEESTRLRKESESLNHQADVAAKELIAEAERQKRAAEQQIRDADNQKRQVGGGLLF